MKKVKLAAACYVDKKEREAGEIVELPDELAEHFGEVVPDEPVVEPTEPTKKPK
jgi:hypothetical protein